MPFGQGIWYLKIEILNLKLEMYLVCRMYTLICHPYHKLTVNLSSRAVGIENGDDNTRRGISSLEP